MGYALVVGIGVLTIVGVVLLARAVRAGGGGRTGLWLALFAVAVLVMDLVASVAAVYYTVPPLWWVVIAAGALVTLTLFVRIGADVGWRPARVLALVGFALGVVVAFTMLQLVTPVVSGFLPLEARAQQIAEAGGFDALLPPDERMITEYLTVEAVDFDGPALSIAYEGFRLLERAVQEDPDAEALRAVLTSGADSPALGLPRVPEDAAYTALEVNGVPAIGVSFEHRESGYKSALGLADVSMLACALDGVEVVLFSIDELRYTGPGEQYEQVPARSVDDLARVAASLVPVR